MKEGEIQKTETYKIEEGTVSVSDPDSVTLLSKVTSLHPATNDSQQRLLSLIGCGVGSAVAAAAQSKLKITAEQKFSANKIIAKIIYRFQENFPPPVHSQECRNK